MDVSLFAAARSRAVRLQDRVDQRQHEHQQLLCDARERQRPMNRSGVQPAKCRKAICTVNAVTNKRRHMIATWIAAALREHSRLAAISCGPQPTMPTQTIIMNSTSGSTMLADQASAFRIARRLASAKHALAWIARTVRLNQGRNGLRTRPVRIAAMNPAMRAQAIAASRSGKISNAHRIVPIESRKIGSLTDRRCYRSRN